MCRDLCYFSVCLCLFPFPGPTFLFLWQAMYLTSWHPLHCLASDSSFPVSVSSFSCQLVAPILMRADENSLPNKAHLNPSDQFVP